MIKASIIGITGYAGIELFRLLNLHPEVEVNHLVSHSQAGEKLADIYPQFNGIAGYKLEEYNIENLGDSDVVFTALPHGVAQDVVGELMETGVKVIDISGDFRYWDQEVYEEWYQVEHKYPDLLNTAIYGLVEIYRSKIKDASLVANPGCYPTASLLGLIPVLKEKIINKDSVIIDAKSGVSGAGRGLSQITHFMEANESVKAYKVAEHRHTSEIESVLRNVSGESCLNVSFTPHLIPMKRGILSTIYADLDQQIEETELIEMYHCFYPEDGFVQILDSSQPDTKYVAGSNYCHLGLKIDQRNSRLIITSVIDNLGKGAAGQAVQNLNVMFGLNEKIGLEGTAVFP